MRTFGFVPGIPKHLLEPAEIIRRRRQQYSPLMDGEPAQNGFPGSEAELLLPCFIQPGGFCRGRFQGVGILRVPEENLRWHVGISLSAGPKVRADPSGEKVKIFSCD